MPFPILGPDSLPAVVAQTDKGHANRTVCWSGMTDIQHLNEENDVRIEYSISIISLILQKCQTFLFQLMAMKFCAIFINIAARRNVLDLIEGK